MGMSASQARLLSITSRMSDLELNTQSISNSKMRLASQSEDISRTYSNSLNQKKIEIQTGFNNGSAQYSDLSYSLLCGSNSPLNTQYGLSDSRGRILVSQAIAKTFTNSPNETAFLIANGAATLEGGNGNVAADYTVALKNANDIKTAYDAACANTINVQAKYSEMVIATKSASDVYDAKKLATMVAAGAVSSFEASHKTITSTGGQQVSGTWQTAELLDGNTEFQSGLRSYIDQNVGSTLDAIRSNYNPDMLKDLDDILEIIENAVAYDCNGNNQIHLDEQDKGFPNFKTFDQLAIVRAALETYREDTAGVNVNLNAFHIEVEVDSLINGLSEDRLTGFYSSYTQGFGVTTEVFDESKLNAAEAAQYALLKQNLADAQAAESAAQGVYDAAAYDQQLYYGNTVAPAVNTEAALKAQYEAATAALAKFNFEDVENVDYFRNLYARMQQGYVTMSDEDSTINNSSWLTNQIQNGTLQLEKVDKQEWKSASWRTDTNIIEDNDDTLTAQVKAKYDTDMSEINHKDKKFDLQLKSIDTEHSALQTEYDSVKKVIDKNIEVSYKIFNS